MVIIIIVARLAKLFMTLFKSINHEVPPMWIRVEAKDPTTKGMPTLQGENGLSWSYGGTWDKKRR